MGRKEEEEGERKREIEIEIERDIEIDRGIENSVITALHHGVRWIHFENPNGYLFTSSSSSPSSPSFPSISSLLTSFLLNRENQRQFRSLFLTVESSLNQPHVR